MAENRKSSPMGDLVSSTRQRIDQPQSQSADLANLVRMTVPGPKIEDASGRGRDSHPAMPPSNYFPQNASPDQMPAKRKVTKVARTLPVNMRLNAAERERLYRWCEDRNLSLPDGVMALLEMAEGR